MKTASGWVAATYLVEDAGSIWGLPSTGQGLVSGPRGDVKVIATKHAYRVGDKVLAGRDLKPAKITKVMGSGAAFLVVHDGHDASDTASLAEVTTPFT